METFLNFKIVFPPGISIFIGSPLSGPYDKILHFLSGGCVLRAPRVAAKGSGRDRRMLSLALCGFESHEEARKDAAAHRRDSGGFSAAGVLTSMADKL